MNRYKKILISALFVFFIILSACHQVSPTQSNELMGKQEDTVPDESLEVPPIDVLEGVLVSKVSVRDLTWAKEEFEKHYFSPFAIYPISYIVSQYIQPLGMCQFVMHGFYGTRFLGEDNQYFYTSAMIYSVEIISNDGSFYQLLDGFTTQIEMHYEHYGLTFGDWNNDGIIDLQLHLWDGGSMRNEPSLLWLWDEESRSYVLNEQLGEISKAARVYLDADDYRVRAFTRVHAGEGGTSFYEYRDENFVATEFNYYYIEKIDETYYSVSEVWKLVGGELQLIESQREKSAN